MEPLFNGLAKKIKWILYYDVNSIRPLKKFFFSAIRSRGRFYLSCAARRRLVTVEAIAEHGGRVKCYNSLGTRTSEAPGPRKLNDSLRVRSWRYAISGIDHRTPGRKRKTTKSICPILSSIRSVV